MSSIDNLTESQTCTSFQRQFQNSIRSKTIKFSRFKPGLQKNDRLFYEKPRFSKILPKSICYDEAFLEQYDWSQELQSDKQFDLLQKNSSQFKKQIIINWQKFIKIKQKNYLKDYTIVKQIIGKGAYGIVQKVKSIETQELRAAKVLKKQDFQQDELNNLFEQLKIMKKIDHPHIIKLYEVYNFQTKIVLIMELCSGGQLYRQAKGKKMQEYKVKNIIKQVLKSLFYLHSRGIMHRDIKPQNILFLEESKQNIKLIDFGVSAQFKKEQYFYQKIGTPIYLSPEIIEERYNQKSDIWALGISMYFLLTGKAPFQGETQTQLYYHIRLSEPNFQDNVWSKVSEECKKVLKLMLSKDISNRPSAQELLQNQYFQEKKSLSGYSTINNKRQSDKNQIAKDFRTFHFKNKLQAIIQTFIAAHILTQQEKQIFMQLFQQFDLNSDGVISTAQLKYSLQKNKKISPERIEVIMTAMDTNGSGQIDYTQFLAAGFNQSKQFQEERLNQVFKYFDADNSGSITYDEVLEFLSNYEQCEQQIRKAFKQFDTNGDGFISKKQFIQLLLKKTSQIDCIKIHQISNKQK